MMPDDGGGRIGVFPKPPLHRGFFYYYYYYYYYY
jgi:hypothetical protein